MGLQKHITRMWSDTRGSVARLFSLTVPVMLLAGGPIVDLSEQIWVSSKLQIIADGAAMAAAREMSLTNPDQALIQKSVLNYVHAHNAEAGISGAFEVRTSVAPGSAGVTVILSKELDSNFSHLVGIDKSNAHVVATAHIIGNTKICALGLEDTEDTPGIELSDRAHLSASGCGVYSNSKSADSVQVTHSAKVKAHLICSSGGAIAGRAASISPDPMSACTPVRDPLAHRSAPPIGACVATGMVVERSTVLFPGTYCGGLTIKKNAWVGLQPGVYVIKDGPFTVEDKAEVSGEQVAFHLDGHDAVFSFAKDTKIELGAPKAGPLQGVLFYEAPAKSDQQERSPIKSSLMALLNISSPKKHRPRQVDRTHLISTSNARQLVGTFYLPNSSLQIDAEGPVADKSPYTAIVARNVRLLKGTQLVLNTDYGATDVPVPRLIAGGDIRLSK